MAANDEYLKSLGNRIRQLRLAKELTQTELAARIDKDYQSLQRVERGAVNLSVQYLRQVAEGLDMKLDELLDFEVE